MIPSSPLLCNIEKEYSWRFNKMALWYIDPISIVFNSNDIQRQGNALELTGTVQLSVHKTKLADWSDMARNVLLLTDG